MRSPGVSLEKLQDGIRKGKTHILRSHILRQNSKMIWRNVRMAKAKRLTVLREMG